MVDFTMVQSHEFGSQNPTGFASEAFLFLKQHFEI